MDENHTELLSQEETEALLKKNDDEMDDAIEESLVEEAEQGGVDNELAEDDEVVA